MSKSMDVKEIYFFGDFSKNGLSSEIMKIRSFSNKIIETRNASAYLQKDFTDFIMLDHIYQEAMQNKDSIDNFIIFTGDGHFNSVVSFLKNMCKKEVGIYAIKGAFSNQLKQTASWWVEYPNDIERYKPYFQMIFNNMNYLEKSGRRDAKPTFIKTIQAVSSHNNVNTEDVRSAMQWLVDNKYIIRKSEYSFGKKLMTISVDWHRVVKDGLWTPEKNSDKENRKYNTRKKSN